MTFFKNFKIRWNSKLLMLVFCLNSRSNRKGVKVDILVSIYLCNSSFIQAKICLLDWVTRFLQFKIGGEGNHRERDKSILFRRCNA